jgi:hypothetical protein
MVLMRDLWNFSFFGRGDVSPSHSELCLSLCFAVIGKTPGLISRKYLVKKSLSASAIAIMSWQDVIPSSLCSGVKECGTKRAYNFLFLKFSFRIRRTIPLGTFKDSAIILDAIRRSLLSKSATAAMFISVRVDFGQPSLVIFYQVPSVSKSRIPPKNV